MTTLDPGGPHAVLTAIYLDHLHTSPKCSYVQTDGALLCDCGAIQTEWERRVAQQKEADHG